MELTTTYILSQVFIIINYLFLVISYQVKKRKNILIFNSLAIISTGISLMFLDAYSGLAMQVVSLIRNIIFFTNDNHKKINQEDISILLSLYTIIIILALFTYNGIFSLMPVFATLIYTYSIWQKNNKKYKYLGILVSICWIIYDIYLISISAIVLESILLISVIYSIIKKK